MYCNNNDDEEGAFNSLSFPLVFITYDNTVLSRGNRHRYLNNLNYYSRMLTNSLLKFVNYYKIM